MKVDVLVHPYYLENVPLRGRSLVPTMEEKTRLWQNAIARLDPTDYLVIISLCKESRDSEHTPRPHELLTRELHRYAKCILGDRMIFHYDDPLNVIGRSEQAWRDRLVLPSLSGVKVVRGYGEIYGACVDVWTLHVAYRLNAKNVEISKELSVSLVLAPV